MNTLEVKDDAWVCQKLRVVVTRGPDKGMEVTSTGDELGVGTESGNALVLTDPTVSGHHIVVRATSAGFLVEDLESTNGTTVEGVRVRSAYVDRKATVGVGTTVLRFEPLRETVREQLPREGHYGAALGASPAMRRIFGVLPRIAAAEATVLLEGETGTGKTLLAEAIHKASPRAKGPFIVVDCGAIPPTLIEGELFGAEKGAYTGAHATRVGAIQAASGGTLFLDEIGELPLDLQPKLLRVLDERVVKRLGSTESVRVDIRVIAATNRDLRLEVNRGRFRSDLFFRLETVRLRVPPLRERREDIELLARHFYRQLAPERGDPPPQLVAELAKRDFPGNVRELRSAIERLVLFDDPEVWSELAGPASHAAGGQSFAPYDAAASFRVAKEQAVASWEAWWLRELVARSGGNLSEAARRARMDRTHLRELLRRHGLADKD